VKVPLDAYTTYSLRALSNNETSIVSFLRCHEDPRTSGAAADILALQAGKKRISGLARCGGFEAPENLELQRTKDKCAQLSRDARS
jgi:hypothetical protein